MSFLIASRTIAELGERAFYGVFVLALCGCFTPFKIVAYGLPWLITAVLVIKAPELVSRNRLVGLAMALGATAIAIEPEGLQRELAIERWWAWTLAAVGVVLTLAALQAPYQRRRTVVDIP